MPNLRERVRVRSVLTVLCIALASALGAHGRATAQGRDAATTATPRAAAPIDLTGFWVSVITQDWRWRMVTPARGDYESIPITLEAKRAGDAWDPAKDEAAGEACKGYGAPAIMSVPARVHITWQDDTTLKVEADAGTQTRVLRFSITPASPSRERTWQGESVAAWERAGGARAGGAGEAAPQFGSLRVVTTNLRPGYLRKNGVPYSANAELTEYWDLQKEGNGDQRLVVTTEVKDPLYLREPWLTALHFKKEPDGAKWDPTPCSARW